MPLVVRYELKQAGIVCIAAGRYRGSEDVSFTATVGRKFRYAFDNDITKLVVRFIYGASFDDLRAIDYCG